MIINNKADGTEYITFSRSAYKVDEIIEFLEKYRGKTIRSGALEEPCLLVDGQNIYFEEFEHLVDEDEIEEEF